MQSPEEVLNASHRPSVSSWDGSPNSIPANALYGYPQHGDVVDPWFSMAEPALQGHFGMLNNGLVQSNCGCGVLVPHFHQPQPQPGTVLGYWDPAQGPSQVAAPMHPQQHALSRVTTPAHSPPVPTTPPIAYMNGAVPVSDGGNYIFTRQSPYQVQATAHHPAIGYPVHGMVSDSPAYSSPAHTSFTSTTSAYPESQPSFSEPSYSEASFCVSAPMPDPSCPPAPAAHSPRDGVIPGLTCIQPKKRASKKNLKKAAKPCPKAFADKAASASSRVKKRDPRTSPKSSAKSTPRVSARSSLQDVRAAAFQESPQSGSGDSSAPSPSGNAKAECEEGSLQAQGITGKAADKVIKQLMEENQYLRDVLRAKSEHELVRKTRKALESSSTRGLSTYDDNPVRPSLSISADSRRPSTISIATVETSASSRRNSDADSVYSVIQGEWSNAL